MHSQYPISPSPIVSTAAAATETMMMNSLINLPEDVLINNILLSKVQTKSLLSLKCVCKYLRNLITSPAFINMHLHHSTASPNHQLNNQLVLIHSQNPEEVFYSLKFNDPSGPEVVKFVSPIKRPRIWGSCNGLLCLTVLFDADKVCLWNPLTKEYKDLPPPLPLTEIIPGITKVRNYVSQTYGLGYDSFIDDYKVIRCEHFVGYLDDDEESYDDPISITEFQVYTLGTNTWRKISPDNNPYKFYFVAEIQEEEPMPFVNGALHWIMSKSDCPGVDASDWTETEIVSFDIEKEVFREIQSPFSELNNHHNAYQIRALKGYLCLHEFDVESYVWMMMDYGVKESWTTLFTIVQKEVEALLVEKEDEHLLCWYRLLRFLENGEILIKTHDLLFAYAYDPINNKARRVEFGETGHEWYIQTEIYIESLVSLNSGVYKGW